MAYDGALQGYNSCTFSKSFHDIWADDKLSLQIISKVSQIAQELA